MKKMARMVLAALFAAATLPCPPAGGYTADMTGPLAGGCPRPDRWNLSLATPLNRRWSNSLPTGQTNVLAGATPGTAAQLADDDRTAIR